MESQFTSRIKKYLHDPKLNEKEIIIEIDNVIKEFELNMDTFSESTPLAHLFEDAIIRMGRLKKTAGVIHTGFEALDKELGGIFPGELIIIGGRPGMGKSQLLIQLILKMSPAHPVLFYTFDLAPFIVVARILSMLTNISANRILRQELTTDEIDLLQNQKSLLNDYKIYVNETGHNTLFLLKAQIKQHSNDQGVKIVVIDYLQLMSTWKNKYNRDQEISFICRELKNMAKELEISIIVISQLSRGVEVRGGSKKPLLSDLRDSGSIEQDADKVIFIYRPEYYQILEDENGISTEGIMELIIAKNRNGNLGSAQILIDKDFTLFSDYNENNRELKINPERLNDLDFPF